MVKFTNIWSHTRPTITIHHSVNATLHKPKATDVGTLMGWSRGLADTSVTKLRGVLSTIVQPSRITSPLVGSKHIMELPSRDLLHCGTATPNVNLGIWLHMFQSFPWGSNINFRVGLSLMKRHGNIRSLQWQLCNGWRRIIKHVLKDEESCKQFKTPKHSYGHACSTMAALQCLPVDGLYKPADSLIETRGDQWGDRWGEHKIWISLSTKWT